MLGNSVSGADYFFSLGRNDGLRNQWRKGWSCLYEYGVGTFPSCGGVADTA